MMGFNIDIIIRFFCGTMINWMIGRKKRNGRFFKENSGCGVVVDVIRCRSWWWWWWCCIRWKIEIKTSKLNNVTDWQHSSLIIEEGRKTNAFRSNIKINSGEEKISFLNRHFTRRKAIFRQSLSLLVRTTNLTEVSQLSLRIKLIRLVFCPLIKAIWFYHLSKSKGVCLSFSLSLFDIHLHPLSHIEGNKWSHSQVFVTVKIEMYLCM